MSKPVNAVPVAVPVAVPIVASEPGPLTDVNGIILGQWKSGICGCFSSIVPNCCMAYWCPCISLGQAMARVGSSGNVYMIAYGLLYLFSMSLAVSTVSYNSVWYWDSDGNLVFYDHAKSGAWRVYFEPWPLLIGSILIMVARGTIRNRFKIPGNCCTDCICSCFCPCCVLAQMSTHVEAYTPGQCSFGFKDTLPSYQI